MRGSRGRGAAGVGRSQGRGRGRRVDTESESSDTASEMTAGDADAMDAMDLDVDGDAATAALAPGVVVRSIDDIQPSCPGAFATGTWSILQHFWEARQLKLSWHIVEKLRADDIGDQVRIFLSAMQGEDSEVPPLADVIDGTLRWFQLLRSQPF